MKEDLVPAAEILGNQVAEQLRWLNKELAAANKRFAELLRHAGKPGLCRTCRAPVLRVLSLDTGNFIPYNLDNTNHTCPEKEKHG